MRRVHLQLAAGLAICAFAHRATDRASAQEPVPQLPSTSLYTWSGPYAGAFAGYASRDFDQSGGASFDGDGFIGGVYTGIAGQSGNVVYGLEADIGGTDIDADGLDAATGSSIGADAGAFGSVRGRLGLAYDPFMLFATGGLAVANTELSLDGDEDDNTHFGYTVGAGIEAAITDNIRSRVEYRFSDFESEDYDLGDVTISSGFDEHSIRAGLALEF